MKRRSAADVSKPLCRHTASVAMSKLSTCTHLPLCKLLREMAVKSDPHSHSLEAFFSFSPSDRNVDDVE